MTVDTSTITRRRPIAVIAIALSTVAIVLAWCWCALVLGDAYDEECKARAAGTSEVSFAITAGFAPLVLVTAGALVWLIATTAGGAARRLLVGVGVLIAATAVGALVAGAFSGWTLFMHFAIGPNCFG
jgi:hypothetical protein